jgi:hypothetical protein
LPGSDSTTIDLTQTVTDPLTDPATRVLVRRLVIFIPLTFKPRRLFETGPGTVPVFSQRNLPDRQPLFFPEKFPEIAPVNIGAARGYCNH